MVQCDERILDFMVIEESSHSIKPKTKIVSRRNWGRLQIKTKTENITPRANFQNKLINQVQGDIVGCCEFPHTTALNLTSSTNLFTWRKYWICCLQFPCAGEEWQRAKSPLSVVAFGCTSGPDFSRHLLLRWLVACSSLLPIGQLIIFWLCKKNHTK